MSTLEFLRFTPQEVPGAIVVNAFAIVSTLALLTVAFRAVWLALRQFLPKASSSSQSSSRESVFFHTVLGNYAACLLIANILSGAAGIMGLDQLVAGGIQEGAFCTAQAIVMQVGNFAGAYFLVAIGIHTFNSLVLAKRQSTLICIITITVGWLAAVAVGLTPMFLRSSLGPHYGISGLSCGIRSVYPQHLFFFHLLPILLASIMSALVYSLIFLVLRGTLVIRGGLKLTLDPNERWGGNIRNYHRFVARIARSMLWFPIAYIIFLVPYSVTRLIDLSGRVCPFPLLVAAYVCWFMLGVANVLTLYNTFRVLGPAFDARTTGQKDLESNVSGSRTRVLPPMIAAGNQYSYQTSSISSMSEKSRPNSLSSFNQVQPASSENSAAPFRLQAPPLAARIVERREERLERTHTRTDSDHSNWSKTPSYYDYGGSTPGDSEPTRLSQLLLNESAFTSSPGHAQQSRRLASAPQPSPITSLPAPPRPAPVPRQVTAHRPVTMEPTSPHGSIEIRFSSTSISVDSGEPDQHPDGYMPRGLISAVGNYNVPPVPAEELPIRRGSFDISRSRSAHATGQRSERTSDLRAPRLSTPEPQPPRF